MGYEQCRSRAVAGREKEQGRKIAGAGQEQGKSRAGARQVQSRRGPGAGQELGTSKAGAGGRKRAGLEQELLVFLLISAPVYLNWLKNSKFAVGWF